MESNIQKRFYLSMSKDDDACVPQFSQSTVNSSTPTKGHEFHPFSPSVSSVSPITSSPLVRRSKVTRKLGDTSSSLGEVSDANKSKPSIRGEIQHNTSSGTSSSLVSSIRNLSIRHDGSSSSSSSLNRKISDFGDSYDGEIDGISPRKKFKRINKGLDWEIYKPQHENRIYTNIILKPESTMGEAKKWINDYINNGQSKAIIDLLQFIVDICGFTQFEIARKFKYDNPNFAEIIRFMQNHPPRKHEHGKYVLRGTSEWCKQTRYGIFDYISHILIFAHDSKILYESSMITYLVEFPAKLAGSCNKAMCHTGISILIKIYTNLLLLNVKMKNQIIQYNKDAVDMLPRLLNSMHLVVQQVGGINEVAFTELYILFCEEAWIWFKNDPQCLQSTKYFRTLLTFVCNASPKVRKAALITCHKLVKTYDFCQYISRYMKDFSKMVGGRIYDTDFTVAVTAINIYSSMIETYPDDVVDNVCTGILRMVLCNHYDLAVACGNFIMKEIYSISNFEHSDTCLHLRELAKIHAAIKVKDSAALFVEALIPNTPQLQQWDNMISLLMSDNLTNEQEIALMEIFCQAASQTISGKSKFQRVKAPAHVKTSTSKKAIINIVLSNLHGFLTKFSNEPSCYLPLIELLMIIDFNHMLAVTSTNNLLYIINTIVKKFLESDNTQLLEMIIKVFSRLMDEECAIKPKVEGCIMNLTETIYNKFFVNCISFLNEVDELHCDVIMEFEHTFMKVSILFSELDMTELINFNDISTKWDTFIEILPPKCFQHLMNIACWYLIWSFRKIIQNGSQAQPENELQDAIGNLMLQCNGYIEKCVDLIQQSNELAPVAFECLCRILITFNDIRSSVRSNQLLKGLVPTFDCSLNDAFTTYAMKELFSGQSNLPLNKRRKMLEDVINTIFLDAIYLSSLPKLYMYFHQFYEDYGDIFTTALQKLQEHRNENLVHLILLSLAYAYETKKLSAPNSVLESEHCKAISQLAINFQMFLKKYPKALVPILEMGINYSTFSNDKHSFLQFLKYFVNPLSKEEKEHLLNHFNGAVTQDDKHNDMFINFLACLTSKTVAKTPAKYATTTLLSNATIELDESDVDSYDTEYNISDFSDDGHM